jgi:hypothetical protein
LVPVKSSEARPSLISPPGQAPPTKTTQETKMKKLGALLFPALAIVMMLGGNALAQNVGDKSDYFVTYYSNSRTVGAPDETVRIINDGDTGGTLWASFYVFDDSQELQECCSCAISADGLLSESVNTELLANPLTGKINTRGVIKVVAYGPSGSLAAGLHGSATHAQHTFGQTYYLTETPLADANLIAGEQSELTNLCSYAVELGSGTGVCRCTYEDEDF